MDLIESDYSEKAVSPTSEKLYNIRPHFLPVIILHIKNLSKIPFMNLLFIVREENVILNSGNLFILGLF